MRWMLALLLVALGATAHAKPADKGLVDKYAQVVEELAQRNKELGAATLELGTLREWLGEARAYLRNDDEDSLKRTMERVRVQARLIDALIGRAQAEALAREAHAAADAAENEAGRLNNDAHTLEEELRQLEAKAAGTGGAK